MSTLSNETICALSTPPGIGGLAVVRVSGPQAISIVDACFRGKRPLGEVASHTIHYGQFLRADGRLRTTSPRPCSALHGAILARTSSRSPVTAAL